MQKVKVSFDVWVQLIGMLGVLAGLIFVGLEMRQSQQIALAAQQQARTSALVSIIGSFSEAVVPANWGDMVSATLNPERGNEEELGNNAAYQLWMLYENDHLQHKLGLMGEGVWEAKVASMQNLYSNCEVRFVSDLALTFADRALTELVRTNVDTELCN